LRKRKIAVFVILAVGFVGAFSIWYYLGHRGVRFVRIADYRVSIPDKPRASGEVYSLGKGKHLLVLVDGSPARYEAYYMDLDRMEIGLPSFDPSRYTLSSHGAWVDEAALEGYPEIGRLAADWRVGEHEVGIRITGMPPEVEKADPIDDPEEFYRRTMPVAYNTEVILTRIRQVR
jgi:hypothetical protein